MHRAKGGMAMRGTISVTVDTLLAVGEASSNPVLHMWVAHALWLVANAAGPSYVPHVKACPCLLWAARLAAMIETPI